MQLLSCWEAGTWKPANKHILKYPAPFLQTLSKMCATFLFPPSPLSSLCISSTLFVLLNAPEEVLSSPLEK